MSSARPRLGSIPSIATRKGDGFCDPTLRLRYTASQRTWSSSDMASLTCRALASGLNESMKEGDNKVPARYGATSRPNPIV